MDQMEWSTLSPEDKKKKLYLQQKDLLDEFLQRNAITKEEYDKSLGNLTREMGMENVLAYVFDESVVAKLFDEIAPKYADRNGGYTRILKLGPRQGDCAEVVFLELVQ